MPGEIRNTDVIILCGGLGSRLKETLPNTPKGLAKINQKPFLDILVKRLEIAGFKRIIFSVGHLKEQIIAHYSLRNEITFEFSEENTPLGTGGGLKNSIHLVKSKYFFVLNGDTISNIDYEKMLQQHKHFESNCTVGLSTEQERLDCGYVCVNDKNQITSFIEKNNYGDSNLINAGIYIFNKKNALSFLMFKPPFSLEKDVFPAMIHNKDIYAFKTDAAAFDIGTPQRLNKAQELFNIQVDQNDK